MTTLSWRFEGTTRSCFLLAVLARAVSGLAAPAPLTDAEKARLAELEMSARRTPALRESAARLAAARRQFLEERKKFAAERTAEPEAAYRDAQDRFERELAEAMKAIDPGASPLLDRSAALAKAGMEGANEGETPADTASARNPAMEPVRDVPGLPRVLLIGDSISIGYTLAVRENLAGRANVHRIPQNGGATEVGLAKIDAWLGEQPWDVIHFNFGLHDAKYTSETEQRAAREPYVANLRTLARRLRSGGARVIFATTTPVPMGGVLSPTRRFDNIEERNRLAVTAMREEGVAINDLHAVVLPRQEEVGRPNDVHFSPEGYEILGTAVAAAIASELEATPAKVPPR